MIKMGRVSGPGGRRLAGVAVLAAFGVLSVVPSAAQASSSAVPAWTLQAPAGHPSARFAASMAYDAATGDVVMFGGIPFGTDTRLADTWIWNGSTWTRQYPAAHPLARAAASMAYDAATGDVVLFGGDTTDHAFADTWTWNGSTWTKQAPATSPPPRFAASMAYDAATGDVVLYGGRGEGHGGEPNGGTWTWDGSTWTKQAPAKNPPDLYGASMAYDAATGNVVLFGGAASGSLNNETWTWDGSAWTRQRPVTSPPAREFAAMAYDVATSNVVLFGGSGNGEAFGDTWTWDGSAWTQQTPAPSPAARYYAVMAYDGATGNVVLSSGLTHTDKDLIDTWTWG